MAKVKNEFDQKYIKDELAQSRQITVHIDSESASTEQYSSPESMHKRQPIAHKGNKSRTKGYQG
jgi:hypothetical protein